MYIVFAQTWAYPQMISEQEKEALRKVGGGKHVKSRCPQTDSNITLLQGFRVLGGGSRPLRAENRAGFARCESRLNVLQYYCCNSAVHDSGLISATYPTYQKNGGSSPYYGENLFVVQHRPAEFFSSPLVDQSFILCTQQQTF